MPQADKRIVGSHLRVITVAVGLREAVQLPSAQAVGIAAAQDLGKVRNMRAPVVVRGSARSIYFDVRSAVGIEHLAGGQEQESAIKGERIGSVRWRDDRIQGRAVKLKKADRKSRPPCIDATRDNGPNQTENMAVRKQRGRSIEGTQQVSTGVGWKIRAAGPSSCLDVVERRVPGSTDTKNAIVRH